MSRAISRASLHVCSVAQNCLAEAYLEQLLRADARICLLNLKQYTQLAPTRRRNLIFVIDQCGMEMPLFECLRQLRDHSSNARFLVLDDQKSNEEIVRILIMGAHGYLPHADAPSALIRAIFCIAADQLWVPHEVLPKFLREVSSVLRKDTQARQTTTPREDEILELVRRRLSNREIADLLQIRVSTVKFHLSNILSKLHAHNRYDLTGATSPKLWKMQLQ
jgi:NarL family two-component system response regulator LiaR